MHRRAPRVFDAFRAPSSTRTRQWPDSPSCAPLRRARHPVRDRAQRFSGLTPSDTRAAATTAFQRASSTGSRRDQVRDRGMVRVVDEIEQLGSPIPSVQVARPGSSVGAQPRSGATSSRCRPACRPACGIEPVDQHGAICVTTTLPGWRSPWQRCVRRTGRWYRVHRARRRARGSTRLRGPAGSCT